jgi:hypothetical protein
MENIYNDIKNYPINYLYKEWNFSIFVRW